MQITVDTGEYEETMTVPSRFDLCNTCEGKGKIDNPAFSNGITSDEWNEPDWSHEDQENYLNGFYDVICGSCNGLRVQEVPDISRCNFAQKRFLVEVRRMQKRRARWAAEEAHEQRMGY